MRDVSIRKVSKRHYIVCIDGDPVYEGLNQKSCFRYLRDQKKEHLRKSPEHISGAPRRS